MTAPTHIAFAELFYLLILTSTGVSLNAVNASAVALASVLADADTESSTVGKSLPFISKRIERRFGHRTLTHSALFCFFLTAVALPLAPVSRDLYICIVTGYASHPFLDTMTVTGVKLFYPFSYLNCVFPLEVNNPHRYRVQTGGKMDITLALFFLIGCVPSYIISRQGYERFIRKSQGHIEAAVRDYNEFSKDHFVFAEITGHSMLTKARLKGRFEIAGALDRQTLLFKNSDGRLNTIGKDFRSDYAADEIVCETGGDSRTTVASFDMSNRFLMQIDSHIDLSAENYIFGELTTADKISVAEDTETFSPVSAAGNRIRFDHARYGDIKSNNLEFAFITGGFIRIKSVYGASAHGADSGIRRSETIRKYPAPFIPLSFTAEPSETIIFLKQKGDTVAENGLIARRSLSEFYGEQIRLNMEQIGLAEEEKSASLADIGSRIAAAEAAVGNNSAAHLNDLELVRNGFAPPAFLEGGLARVRKSERILAKLLSEREAIRKKHSQKTGKLKLLNSRLEAKRKSAAAGSEIRSRAGGIVEEIREQEHNGKSWFMIILRRPE